MPFLDAATMLAIEAALAAAHQGGVISYTRPAAHAPPPPPSNGVYAGLVARRPPPRPRDPATTALLGKLGADLGAVAALALLLAAPPSPPAAETSTPPAAALDVHGREIIEGVLLDEDEQ